MLALASRNLAQARSVRITLEGKDLVDQMRAIERFYRAQAATDAAVQGIGLGLSICKAIGEGHGGSIEVASELGKGTTFTVKLPMEGRYRTERPEALLPG